MFGAAGYAGQPSQECRMQKDMADYQGHNLGAGYGGHTMYDYAGDADVRWPHASYTGHAFSAAETGRITKKPEIPAWAPAVERQAHWSLFSVFPARETTPGPGFYEVGNKTPRGCATPRARGGTTSTTPRRLDDFWPSDRGPGVAYYSRHLSPGPGVRRPTRPASAPSSARGRARPSSAAAAAQRLPFERAAGGEWPRMKGRVHVTDAWQGPRAATPRFRR
eukprot:TRINITY_DN5392_c0_g1_i1.p1 TRINITY_DN5392_c0_g1~~TRINITY_DN5392_c0_g1_i1.p1  ORF type:complete len:221 (-),score=13.61 TRINITY_DN5392_c0_g1_i1:103-765(-)